MKSIVPYTPQPFPPRKPISRGALFKKAEQALEHYCAFLAAHSSSRKLLQPLEWIEALASTQAQKTKTQWRELFLKEGPHDKITKYTRALHWGYRRLAHAPLSTKLLCTLHKKIKQGFTPKIDLGVFRNRQNWIGPEGCTIEEAYFYPPAKEKVGLLMKKLCAFAEKKSPQPLIQIPLILGELLLVHPFMDGNGRIARMLVPLFLFRKKAVPFPCVFLSPYFKRHRLRYILTLNAITDKKRWDYWTAFFLKGVLHAIKKERAYLEAALALHEEMRKEKIPSQTLNFLFKNPLFPSFKNVQRTQALKKWVRRDRKGIYHFVRLEKLLQNFVK